MTATLSNSPLVLGSHAFESRLIVGTGKYATYELMRDCLDAAGAEVVTVAVRRERLIDAQGRSILDFLDLARYTILPNTAGCFSADDAVRVARLGREILLGLENPGADWVKLEVLGDKKRCSPIRSPRSKRPCNWSKRAFKFCATRPMIRSRHAASRKRAPHRSCRQAARSAADRECSIPITSASASSI